MDYNSLIGKEFSKVKNMLREKGISIITKDNNSGSGVFDTELIVRVKEIGEDIVEIITSKFLINLEEL